MLSFLKDKFSYISGRGLQENMSEQKEIINKAIEAWKNSCDKIYEQTDDITVMGLKIS
jgi:hypothetical protein